MPKTPPRARVDAQVRSFAIYPFLRLFKDVFAARNQPPLALDDTHVSHHICWPIDIDPFGEMNNGRILTIYDLGRIPLARRGGLLDVLRKNQWGLTMAGACVRYRRRLKVFSRFEMHSRCVGRDARFIYIDQSMWHRGEATSHIIYRSAVTSPAGIVPTQDVADAMGTPDWNPDLPDFVKAWIAAEATRPWPPEL